MSDIVEEIDDYIVFELTNHGDSLDGVEKYEPMEMEEEFQNEDDEEIVETLDDSASPKTIVLIDNDYEEGEEAEAEQVEVVKVRPANPSNGPRRYILFDELVANIVDYDRENTPIVEFTLAGADEDDKLPVECGICPDVMDKVELAVHLKTHLVPGTNRYRCIYCDETYKDHKYLAGHARRHMGIRPYVCEPCKLYFSTKQDLRVHKQRRHLAKELICEICGKTFSQNTMLKRHREATHEKKRRFKCPSCPKAYYKNYSLQEHIRNVHMGERRMLTCPFCGMQCRDAHKMARHRKFLHLNQSHYQCHICQEQFTDINYFDAHKRSIQCRNNTKRKMEEEQQQMALQNEEGLIYEVTIDNSEETQ